MKTLDQIIRDETEMFDDKEPAEGHFERFELRLEALHASSGRPKPVRLWLKIAAGITILMTAGLSVYELATRDFSQQTSLRQSTLGLPAELTEVLDIYESRTNLQMKELTQLAQTCPNSAPMVKTTQNEVARLDRNMVDLISALKENPSDDRVQNALIRNCKAKESLLCDMLLREKMKKCN